VQSNILVEYRNFNILSSSKLYLEKAIKLLELFFMTRWKLYTYILI